MGGTAPATKSSNRVYKKSDLWVSVNTIREGPTMQINPPQGQKSYQYTGITVLAFH
jgi:hypothetical protein